MRITLKFILIAAFFCLLKISEAQDKKTFKTNFLEAEYFMLNEEYKEAAFLYNEMLKSDPSNANLHFLVGACYLSINGRKKMSIPHLEKAVSNVSAGYREGSYRETDAPRVAFYALARAYHINNQFDKAIEYYKMYKRVMKISDVAEVEFINRQIFSIELAKEYINDTLALDFLPVFEMVSPDNSNYRAVFAEKDSIIVFMTYKPFYSAIMMSKLKNGSWTEPEMINDQLEIDGNYNLCSITYDATELYLAVNRDFNWDLYVSYYEGQRWTPVQALGKIINTKFNETHASLTRDKRMMYFTSDRPGSMGALDIYYSLRDEGGDWQKPLNIGEPVNNIYSEETPFVSADGKTLYFSSMSHATMGGFDIFYSTRLPNNSWSYPANLGYPISTSDDDLFFVPLEDGKQALFSSEGDVLPQHKIVLLDLEPEDSDLRYAFRGTITTEDRFDLDESAIVSIIDTEKKKPIAENIPVSETGEFNVEVPAGKYQLTVKAEGYDPAEEFISILPRHRSKNIEIGTSLTPSSVSEGKYALVKGVLFDFDSFRLTDEAKHELEKLYILLSENPDLYVEVTGYTDAIGSEEYNLQLAHKRSGEVVSYLVSKGIPRESFISKAAGKSDFIARNKREDGADSPEGRRYNRRVEINLINTGDKDIVMEEILVPENLKSSAYRNYYVILEESGSAKNTIPSEMENQSVKLYETGNRYIYATENYFNRQQAIEFLNKVIDTGFPDSRIISENDFNVLTKPSVPELSELKGPFIIQLLAMKVPVSDDFFKLTDEVFRIEGNDGIFRYITGVFDSFEEAQKQLPFHVKNGFTDAFVNQLSRYWDQTGEHESEDSAGYYYTVQFSALIKPPAPDYFKDTDKTILTRGNDGFYRYSSGIFFNISDAEKHLLKLKDKGFYDAFVRKIGYK